VNARVAKITPLVISTLLSPIFGIFSYCLMQDLSPHLFPFAPSDSSSGEREFHRTSNPFNNLHPMNLLSFSAT
jgi:hypothetical protein